MTSIANILRPQNHGVGYAAKSLGGNRIGEYGILYGSQKCHDDTTLKDYFTPSTDFWLDKVQRVPMIYRHSYVRDDGGYAAKFSGDVISAIEANPVIGWWELQKDDVGVWFEGELEEAHGAYGAMKTGVDAGELLISSDSVLHLTRRRRNGDGTHEVTRYPVVGGSLAPDPAESRMAPVAFLQGAFKALNIPFEIPVADENENNPVVMTPKTSRSQSEHSEAARETARTYVERVVGFAAMKSMEGKELSSERVAEIQDTLKIWELGCGALKALLPNPEVISDGITAIRQAREERSKQFHGE